MHVPPPRAAFLVLLLVAALAGCATAKNPRDPLEPLNRTIYAFNQDLDRVALKPAALVYREVVPTPVRGGVTSFFGNFRDVTTAINNLLQLKVKQAASDVGRVAINSTVGILGVFDVASRLGLQKHEEDFGQTLGRWGVKDGPYVVLPLLGPSNARDAVGWVGDYFTDPEFYLIEEDPWTWIVFGTRVVNVRTNLLEAERLLEQAAVDRYSFLREAYLQRRRNLIYDGSPPDAPPGGQAPRRKTLKEMEEELELDEPPAQPPAPAGEGAMQ
jgi:phospholipid-binding lipoprotein MlaA